MNFDDLKDKISSELRTLWDKIQDSSAYNQLRDKYDNLAPGMQKLVLFGGIALLALFILSIPYSNINQSSAAVEEFESKRATIRELLKVTREASEAPSIAAAPSANMIRTQVESEIKSARLLPEQIKGTSSTPSKTPLIPDNLVESTLEIRLAKLNLRQIIDLGYKFQSISSSVKMKDMVINANFEDSRYFDVIYQLVSLAVPAPPEPVVEEAPSKDKRPKKQPKDAPEE